jgi:hypothetical protein
VGTFSWELLAELARREHELVQASSWEDLLGLQDERGQVIASAPSPPPAEAREPLEEALQGALETEAALQVALAETGGVLAALRRGRRAVRAYGRGPRSGLDARV